MSENKPYYIIQDNLGEYSVLKGEERIFICSEIEYKEIAELFCDELNDLAEENEQLKESIENAFDETKNKILKLYRNGKMDKDEKCAGLRTVNTLKRMIK